MRKLPLRYCSNTDTLPLDLTANEWIANGGLDPAHEMSWERGPYFLDNLVPLACLLNNSRLKDKAQKFIEWTLTSQRGWHVWPFDQ